MADWKRAWNTEPGAASHRPIAKQPGLEMRMRQGARRISSQHRQLDTLHATIVDAVRRGSAEDARRSLVRFGDALEAHLSLEDEFYFPALHGMRPELGRELVELFQEHEGFRERLERLRAIFEGGDLTACQQSLADFVTALSEHEMREEQLLARIRGPGGAS